MKKLNIFVIISLVADLFAISEVLMKALLYFGLSKETAQTINGYMILVSIIFTCFFVGAWFLAYCIKDELRRVGTRGIPCAIWPYIHYKVLNKHYTMLTIIHHGLYHKYFSIKQQIINLKNDRGRHIPITVEDIAPQLGELLQEFYTLLYNAFHIDLSISIFRVSESDNHRPILTKVAFHRSKYERGRTGHREVGTPYLIDYNDDQAITNYTNRARDYHTAHGNEQYLKNSVFDHIMSTNEHSWISNDLTLDKRNNFYFSSSPNSEIYYRSMAAFAILPPDCVVNQHAAIKGIIAFDSSKTNLFSNNACSFVMGLMAHIVFEIFDKLNP